MAQRRCLSISLTLFFLTAAALHASGQQTDFLAEKYAALLLAKLPETQRIDSINQLIRLNYRKNYDEAYAIAVHTSAKAKALHYQSGEVTGMLNLGSIEEGRGNFTIAERYLNEAISILANSRNQKELARAYLNMGWLQRRFLQRGKAMTYVVKGLAIAEKLNDTLQIANGYNTIAALAVDIQDYDRALLYHRKALALRQLANDKFAVSASFGNIGIVNLRLKRYDSAIAYHKKALEVIQGTNNLSREAFIYNDIGAAYLSMGNIPEAKKYLLQSIGIREKLNEKNELAYTYNYLGEAYNHENNIRVAEQWIKKALVTAKEIKNSKQNYEALESLSDFYAANRLYDSAYVYLHQYKIYGDSIAGIEKAKEVRDLTVKYETEKKEAQIGLLQQQTLLQSLQLRQRDLYLIAALGSILALLIIGYLVFTRRRWQAQAELQREKALQQETTAKEILKAEERERRRMASDLHDGVGQLLSTALLSLNRLGAQAVNSEQQMLTDQSLALVTESYDELRSISHQIIPNALLKHSLGAAIRDFLSKIDERKIKVSLEIEGIHERLEEQKEIILYRIIQEATTNVIKHAAATKCSIQLIKDAEGITLTIEDNGKGCDLKTLQNAEGIGMKNIYSRVAFLKGTVDLESSEGKGTVIAICIP